jgi:PAS domain-containing protein
MTLPPRVTDAQGLPRAPRYDIQRKPDRGSLLSSEERFSAMSDASPLGIVVSDIVGSGVYTNAAYQAPSGLTPEQSLGTNGYTALQPADRERVLAEWHDAALNQAIPNGAPVSAR